MKNYNPMASCQCIGIDNRHLARLVLIGDNPTTSFEAQSLRIVQGKATYDPDSTFSNMLNARPSPWSF
jgi:hypothetical protein